MSTSQNSHLETVAKTVQLVSVVAGVVISVMSFNATSRRAADDQKAKETDSNATRIKEAEAQKLAAVKPFLELRQKLYLEALRAAGVLSNPEVHSVEEQQNARKRFRELYVAELSMVEESSVEGMMKALAAAVDEELLTLTPAQRAAYDLSHALGKSFVAAWGLEE